MKAFATAADIPIKFLNTVQNSASRTATSAYRTSPIFRLYALTSLLSREYASHLKQLNFCLRFVVILFTSSWQYNTRGRLGPWNNNRTNSSKEFLVLRSFTALTVLHNFNTSATLSDIPQPCPLENQSTTHMKGIVLREEEWHFFSNFKSCYSCQEGI